MSAAPHATPATASPPTAGRVLRRLLPPALVVLVLIGLWQAAARWDLIANALQIEPFLVPAPTDIAEALWHDRALLADNAWVTIKEVALGFALAAVCGFAFALALHLSDVLRRVGRVEEGTGVVVE